MKTIVRAVAVTAILALAFGGTPKPLNGNQTAYCPVYRFFYNDNGIMRQKTCSCSYDEYCLLNPAYPEFCTIPGWCQTANNAPSGSVFNL